MIVQRDAIAMVLDMSATGLGITRSLAQYKIPIVGLDFRPNAPGLRSQYCKGVLTRSPSQQPTEVLNLMLRESKRFRKKAILFLASDEYVLFVSRFRKELAEYFSFAIPSENIIEAILDKQKQYRLAERIGIPAPLTQFPRTLGEVERMKDEMEYPVFIKPYTSHVWRNVFRNKGFVVTSPEELVEHYKYILQTKLPAMVQSIVEGSDSNIVEVYAYMSSNSEPIAAFVTRKLRQYPNKFGVATCLESIHDREALEIGLKFFRGVSYVGLGSIEFKKDDRDGCYKLLELNPRLPTHNIQATYAGINFPLAQYMDLTGMKVDRLFDYKSPVTWLDAFQDLRAFFNVSRERKPSFLEWMRFVRKVDCHAYYARDDLKPFLRQYLNYVSEIPQYLASKFRSSNLV